jgi:hypothetical protein
MIGAEVKERQMIRVKTYSPQPKGNAKYCIKYKKIKTLKGVL